jgi:glucose-1-phosphate adenylyltransferase
MVVNSVLSPGVVVGVGAVVRDSIVMFDSVIRPGAIVDRAILDKEVTVGPGAIVGEGTDLAIPNRLTPSHLNTGITLVGKQAVIPRGVRIGRNVRVDSNVRATDFPGRTVESGATIVRREGRGRSRQGSPVDPERAAGHEPGARSDGSRAATTGRGSRAD